MIDVKIDISKAELSDLLGGLKAWPKQAALAVSRAANRTATSVRANVVKRIRQTIAVKAGTLKAQLFRISRATSSAPEAKVYITGRRLGLIEFGGRDTKKRGVTYRISRSGGRQVVPDAFIANTARGPAVMRRQGAPRLPLVFPKGVSFPHLVDVDPGINQYLKVDATETFRRNLMSEIAFRLSQKRGG